MFGYKTNGYRTFWYLGAEWVVYRCDDLYNRNGSEVAQGFTGPYVHYGDNEEPIF